MVYSQMVRFEDLIGTFLDPLNLLEWAPETFLQNRKVININKLQDQKYNLFNPDFSFSEWPQHICLEDDGSLQWGQRFKSLTLALLPFVTNQMLPVHCMKPCLSLVILEVALPVSWGFGEHVHIKIFQYMTQGI